MNYSVSDEKLYNMQHQSRGKLIIFNNRNFRNMPKREGSDADASKIYQTFKALGFQCKMLMDKKAFEMKEAIYEESRNDHTNEDCIALCILTHGDEKAIYGSDGMRIPLEDMIVHLKTCRTLVGKPKLLFVESSLGDKEDKGILIEADGPQGNRARGNDRIPIEADFLYSFSTAPGYKSLRTSDVNSSYINALCEMMQQFGKKKEITEVLTRVNFKVGIESHSSSNLKQIPCFVSHLTKLIYF